MQGFCTSFFFTPILKFKFSTLLIQKIEWVSLMHQSLKLKFTLHIILSQDPLDLHTNTVVTNLDSHRVINTFDLLKY